MLIETTPTRTHQVQVQQQHHHLLHQTNKSLLALSAFSIQGKRQHMEDYFDIGYQMKPCDQRRPNEWPYEFFYLAIFDGHGGHEAASFAKRNLLKYITAHKDFWSDNDEDVMRAIRQGYADTHAAMKQEMHCWSKTSRVLPSTAGTTASVLFIKNGKYYTGHVGDSRIVISNQNPETKHWISHQLTEDHKPESKSETERIKRAGGEVKSKIGVHRVVWRRPLLHASLAHEMLLACDNKGGGVDEVDVLDDLVTTYPVEESLVASYQTIPFLAIARSLGDFWSINPYSGQYIVSPEPDVSCKSIDENDKCILLATDGLWNVMNSSTAIRFLQELDISKNGNRDKYEKEYFTTDNFYDVAGQDSDNHAQSLVYFAYQIWERRRLRSDNITVVVAMLHDILDYFRATKNKTYQTRASLQAMFGIADKNKIDDEFSKVKPNLVQIKQTNCFAEKINLNSEPLFSIKDQEIDEKWHRLENFLVLPPTIIEQERDYKYPKLIYPKNYMRLSNATCRKITRARPYGDCVILIKQVSDDPSDAERLPTRIGKTGKEVRDASAQATQSIHDFGQPWDQLLDDNLDTEEEIDKEAIKLLKFVKTYIKRKNCRDNSDEDVDELMFEDEEDEEDELDRDSKLVFEHEQNPHPDDELVFEHELEDLTFERELDKEDSGSDDEEHKETSEPEVNVEPKPSKGEDTPPKLRCLLNRTPPLRRSARHSYLSVSDNAKRKSQVHAGQPLPKSKRRKSQPVRCSLRA